MPYYRRKKVVATKPKRSVPTRSRRPTRKRPTFTKKVKTILNKELETKFKTVYLQGSSDTTALNIKSSGLLLNTNGLKITNLFASNNLTIDQGVLQNQRVGREITNCSLYLKATIQATFHNESTNTGQFPFDVYMIVYRDKLQPNTNTAEKLKLGVNGVGTHITGSAQNIQLPFNKDRYTIYTNRRVARFKPMPADRVELPTGSSLQNPTIGSSDNIAFKNIKYKIPCPKKLQFVQGSYDLVTNHHVAIGFYVVDGSGVALGNSQIRATVYPQATLYFLSLIHISEPTRPY